MAITANSLRLVMVGTLPGGDAVNTGFWVRPETPPESLEDLILEMAVAQTAVNQWLSDSSGDRFGQAWTELRGYYYQGGEFGSNATFVASLPIDTSPGSASGLHLPDQIAVVASTRTGLAGRSYRGRMYLPLNGLVIQPTGQLSQTQVDAIRTYTTALLSACLAGSLTPVIVSATQSSAVPITTVVVDSVMDTQRRRRNKLVPVATSTGVVGA